MARVIAVCNQKGGVGKTTTAVNLGAALAAAGRYVLLVDLDSQANATLGLGLDMPSDAVNIYHSLILDANPHAAVRTSGVYGYDVLPATQALAGATVELVTMEEREFRLRRVLNHLRNNYDYILVDCPPSLDLLTVNALVAADKVLIPVQCEYFALEGLGQLMHSIELVRGGLNPDLQVLGVVLTMHDQRNALARQVADEVAAHFPGRVFGSVIPRTVAAAEAPSFGKSLLDHEPDSKASVAYHRLAEEIIQVS